MSGISIGTDPEFLIVKGSGEQETLASAIKVLKGHGKSNKLPISGDQAVFYDNVLLEFNVNPAHTLAELKVNLKECFDFVWHELSKKGHRIKAQASATFPQDQCDDEEAFVFGCEPEFCIYNMSPEGAILPSSPPSLPKGNTFRSCGGHIHLGHPIATIERGNPPMVVKLMDAFIGSTALLIDHDPTSVDRRKLYGGAGTHRIASYGLEYRTLSNFWLQSPPLVEIIYKLTRMVVQIALTEPTIIDNIIQPKELQELINKGNKGDAVVLYEKIRRVLPHELQNLIDRARDTHWTVMEEEWETYNLAAAA